MSDNFLRVCFCIPTSRNQYEGRFPSFSNTNIGSDTGRFAAEFNCKI
jgi:hypothetical protein